MKMARPSFENFISDKFLKGVEYSLANSFYLFNDGILLLNNERLCRAYTLFQLSIEESGKVILLLDYYYILKIKENNLGLIDDDTLKQYHKRIDKIFYSHPQKTDYSMKYELKSLNDYIKNRNLAKNVGIVKQRDELELDLKNIDALNDLKNHSLYTFIESEQFAQPIHKFDIDIVNKIKFKAFSKIMLTKNKTVRFLKERQATIDIDLEKLDALKLDHSY